MLQLSQHLNQVANLLERQVSTRVGRVQEAHFPDKAADTIPILRGTC